jgi:DNA-binding transcriptional ArsR family regulator
MSDKITLDRETFKALAADTRVDMLKKLGEHKLTLTDLSEQMHMSPSTIKEHLDRLVEVGLIEQEDKGMKWKYYRLTEKGKNIISPYETKVWILLATSLLIIVGCALSIAGKLAIISGHPSLGAVAMSPTPSAALMKIATEEKAVDTVQTGLGDNKEAATPTTGEQEQFANAAPVGYDRMMLSAGMGGANETEGDGEGPTLMKAATENPAQATQDNAAKDQNAIKEDTAKADVTSAAPQRFVAHKGGASARPPYIEIALICACLIIAGACTGYLLRKRIHT